jgi:hypothetical protein
MIWFVIISFLVIGTFYVSMEIMHYRKGHDVYEWTKKLVKWMDSK